MSLFEKLFGRKLFQRFPDSFTLTQPRQLATLCEWTRDQTRLGKRVLVLSHFQSTFLKTQATLQDAEIDFEILIKPVSGEQLIRQFDTLSTRVLITMSQLLRPATMAPPGTASGSGELSVIVMERYPLIRQDEQLEDFLRQTTVPVSVGYLLSFDDPVLRHLMGERFIRLMKHLGLGDNDLVSSTMTHRGFSRRLREATSRITEEKVAESPDEWVRLNLD